MCVPQTLQEVSSLHKASHTEAQAQYNQNKNRFPDRLPSEYGLSCWLLIACSVLSAVSVA